MSLTINDAVRRQLKADDVSLLEKAATEFMRLVGLYGKKEFLPCAYYDQPLDCIRVVVRDCSTCEFRINEWLTVLHDTDQESDVGPVGFTLKGIRTLLDGEHANVVKLVEILDALAKRSPGETVAQWVFQFKKLSHKNKLDQVRLEAA